jgi:hypothetical protein
VPVERVAEFRSVWLEVREGRMNRNTGGAVSAPGRRGAGLRGVTALVTAGMLAALAAMEAQAEELADILPKERPRMLMSPAELAKRIEWARPGGPLAPYLESLKTTVATDRSWSAWYRVHAALLYLLTGEEEFAEKAYAEKSTWGQVIPELPVIYDWLVAGDEHWGKHAFPEAERKKIETELARMLGGGLPDAEPWTPDSYTTSMASHLAAARALLGVPEYDAEARKVYNTFAEHMVTTYLPAWNVPGGFMPCGVSYGSVMTDNLTFACAMMEGLTREYDPWKVSRYAQERLPKKLAQDVPHTGEVEGLGGLPEMHGDVNAVGYCDRWSVGILTRAYKDPLGQWYLRNIYPSWGELRRDGDSTTHEIRSFLPLLFVDPDITPVGPNDAKLPLAYYTPYHRPYKGNPNAEGDGQVILRSHWGDADQTYLYFRSGDFFDGHQDVGNLHFSLYRKGYFAVPAASRHTYDSANFREIVEYNHTSLPRNTIQIYDTDMPQGPWNALKVFFEGSQNHYCQRAYREGGHVEAFETNDTYSYVNADATPMYAAMYVDQGNPKRDRATEVRRQLIYVRSNPPGSDDLVIIFDRVSETPENFAVVSPLKVGGASARWFMNVATAPRRAGEVLRPGIRTFETAGAADTYTLPAGGLWPGEENPEAQCHVQVLLPEKRTVRWVGGIDPDFDVPSTNLVPGLYRIRLVGHDAEEVRKHPDFGGGPVTDRYTFRGENRAGRVETEIPFFDPNIGRVRCGFWLQPAAEARRLESGEFLLWQARVTKERLTILLNGQTHADYALEKYPTVRALEEEMVKSLRTPGNKEPWKVALIRGYEWWADNWRVPTLPGSDLGDPKADGFEFDEPAKVGWPIPGSALDGHMFQMGGIYAKAYPLYAGKDYSQRGVKQICGLWRMETMARGEDDQPQVHFLHVLSPVDAGVAPPEVACRETDTDVALSVKTAKGKTVNLTLRKLGQPAGGRIRIESAGGVQDRELTTTVDLTGAQPGL